MVDFDCVVTISLPFLPLASPSPVLPNSPCPPAAHLHVSGSFGSFSSNFKGYDWLTLEYILLLPMLEIGTWCSHALHAK
ncbi:hypothetical protein B0H11DRAFT_2101604 [Mycena galericulata]|nr:hypothetical protein B0H11DRAFT_2101604 [Mycena galericulata]